jgi:hypothetical protein
MNTTGMGVELSPLVTNKLGGVDQGQIEEEITIIVDIIMVEVSQV